MEIITYLIGEWKVISQAPAIFLTGLAIIGIAIYFFVRHQYSERISSLEARLQLRDDRIADYENKLNSSSPDEAKARMDELESRLTAFQADMAQRSPAGEPSTGIDMKGKKWGFIVGGNIQGFPKGIKMDVDEHSLISHVNIIAPTKKD